MNHSAYDMRKTTGVQHLLMLLTEGILDEEVVIDEKTQVL